MQKLVKPILILMAVAFVAFGALAIVVSSVDANKYRSQLVDMLSKKTGREIKLKGPIGFSLGFGGLHVSVQDASIANPAWATRPVMAGMGKFELSLSLLPLLAHNVVINKLSIENADILLETDATGKHNWDINQQATAAPSSGGASPSLVTSLSVNGLAISNSQLAFKDAQGNIKSYNLSSLDLSMHRSGAVLKLKGDMNGAVVTANVKTSLTDFLSPSPFTFEADTSLNALHVTLQGNADRRHSKASITAYDVSVGKTKITGELSADWSGARPVLQGKLESDHLDLADFNSGEVPAAREPTSAVETKTTEANRVFSTLPLPLDGLKAADADLTVAIGELPLGKSVLKQISAKLALVDGNLTISPLKASVGASPIDIALNLNATQSPAHFSLKVTGNGVDLSDLQKLGGMSPFMTGNAAADIEITGEGNSPHDIASSLTGVITITAEKGEILMSAASEVSSLLAAIFSPKGSSDALNCLAARFIAKNGVLADNGILIDSAASTVSGKGTVNLNSEGIALTLHARTKLVDIGGLVPALQIGGNLKDPTYSVDAVGVVQNAVGSLLNGNINIVNSSNVPQIGVAPAGQNSCVYTLDHPQAASSSNSVLPADAAGKASQKIQNIGNSLIKGLFNH